MRLGWISVVFGAAACATAGSRGMELPATLVLGEGESAVAGGLELRFRGVEAETRCPPRVYCVRAGEARIALEAAAPGEPATVLRLWTAPADSMARDLGDYSVRLDSLSPRPESTATPYRAWLTVTRR